MRAHSVEFDERKSILDKKVILQVVRQNHGTRSEEHATTFRDYFPVIKGAIKEECWDDFLILVLMEESESGEMVFSRNSLISMKTFIEICEKEMGNG